MLDVGVGMGKWGVLVREYCDSWGVTRLNGRHTVIHGIEGDERYIGDLHRAVYDDLFIGDLIQIIPTLDPYDMLLCIDVLEHLQKPDGLELLAWAKASVGRSMFAIPHPVSKQGAVYGNEFERHRSHWSEAELRQFGRCWTTGPVRFLAMVQAK